MYILLWEQTCIIAFAITRSYVCSRHNVQLFPLSHAINQLLLIKQSKTWASSISRLTSTAFILIISLNCLIRNGYITIRVAQRSNKTAPLATDRGVDEFGYPMRKPIHLQKQAERKSAKRGGLIKTKRISRDTQNVPLMYHFCNDIITSIYK